VQSVIAAAMALNLGIGSGIAVAASPAIGTPAIGTIAAKGSFRVDNATVANNATLFEGATIETAAAGSSMQLSSGAKMVLAAESKGRFFGDHMVLERGQGSLERSENFRVEARGLTIQPETGNATGRVVLANDAQVQVAALSGSFQVLNSRGMVVAKIPPGIALAFEPQASSEVTKLTGRLENRGGHYLITDETTNVTVEVTGSNLAKLVGKRVEVTGSQDPTATPVSDASQIIRVTSVKPLPGTGTAAAGSGGATTQNGGSRRRYGTVIALIGGVAVAGVVGGLAAAGGLGQGGGAGASMSR
jgi:hypothetical protein